MQPCIVLTECKDGLLQASKTSLVLDCVDIVDDDSMDISLAFSCMMAAYFVYGIQYPRKLKNTLAFMQHFVFGISPPGDKIPYMVQRAANMLCGQDYRCELVLKYLLKAGFFF